VLAGKTHQVCFTTNAGLLEILIPDPIMSSKKHHFSVALDVLQVSHLMHSRIRRTEIWVLVNSLQLMVFLSKKIQGRSDKQSSRHASVNYQSILFHTNSFRVSDALAARLYFLLDPSPTHDSKEL
jgi:hypothetical protein